MLSWEPSVITEKACYCCGEKKSIDNFYRHSGMKDGYLNLCKACNTIKGRERRERIGKSEERRQRYLRELEIGSRTRKREIKVDGKYIGRDPEVHRTQSLRYAHKRRAGESFKDDELTDLCMLEAASLIGLRRVALGGRWTIDHIVPLKHKDACGLHVAANIQVVPASWNFQKGRSNMQAFWN